MNPNSEGCPYVRTWKSCAGSPCTYIRRAYQSPCSGTHCAVQCAQIPNLASRNQVGVRYCFKDSHVGSNGPATRGLVAVCVAASAVATARDRAAAGMPPARSCINLRLVSMRLSSRSAPRILRRGTAAGTRLLAVALALISLAAAGALRGDDDAVRVHVDASAVQG